MSKTTIFLLILFFTAIGTLFFFMYINKNEPFITSISEPIRSVVSPMHTSLSIAANTQNVQPGQTITFAVLIHNPNPHPGLVQLEISYDPTMMTVDSLIPGTFFNSPAIALQNIDPVTGRISYALRCSSTDTSGKTSDCVNSNSSTVAVITMTISQYAYNHTPTLSFLPKTVVRTNSGRDLLQNTK